MSETRSPMSTLPSSAAHDLDALQGMPLVRRRRLGRGLAGSAILALAVWLLVRRHPEQILRLGCYRSFLPERGDHFRASG